jgi:hypothetical protein
MRMNLKVMTMFAMLQLNREEKATVKMHRNAAASPKSS